MKRKITEIKLIVLLSVIFCIMFTMFYFTMNINTSTILMKADKTIKCLNETSTETENNTNTTTNTDTTTNSSKENTTDGKTNNTAGTSQSSKKTTVNNSRTNNAKTTTKSSNADLSNLGIRPHDFSGFTPSKTTYDVTVPKDVTEVEVYATAQSGSAKIKGTGKKELKDGKNELAVVVTAESGATKTYTINVTKEAKEDENTEDVTQIADGKGLSSLKIDNIELSPKFETNVYEYTATYIGDLTKLNITAKATDEKYVIETIGNEDLKEGENIITVLVSDDKGDNIATYQITLTKSLVDKEAIAREEAEAKKKEETRKMLIIGGVLGVVIIAIIIYLVIRHRRNSVWEEDYMMSYSEDGNEFIDDEYDYEDDNNDNENYDDEYMISKKEAREQFLNGYNNDADDYYDEEKPRRRSKGKRFK